MKRFVANSQNLHTSKSILHCSHNAMLYSVTTQLLKQPVRVAGSQLETESSHEALTLHLLSHSDQLLSGKCQTQRTFLVIYLGRRGGLSSECQLKMCSPHLSGSVLIYCTVLHHTDFKTKSQPQWLPIWKLERK